MAELHKAGAALALTIAGCVGASSAWAAEADPGDYVAAPPGTDLALLYYQHSSAGTYRDADGDKVAGHSRFRSDIGIFRYVHFAELWGYTIDPQVVLPFGRLDDARLGGADIQGNSGIGDPQFTATLWLLNDPAAKRWFGISPFVVAPLGTYDKHEAFNLGENRWKGIVQAGYVQGLGECFSWDWIGDVTWYGRNDEAGDGNQTLRQQRSYQMINWLSYHLDGGSRLAVGYSTTHGGKQELDGEDTGSRTRVDQWRALYATPVGTASQFQVALAKDLNVRGGFERDYQLNFRIAHSF